MAIQVRRRWLVIFGSALSLISSLLTSYLNRESVERQVRDPHSDLVESVFRQYEVEEISS